MVVVWYGVVGVDDEVEDGEFELVGVGCCDMFVWGDF